MSQAHHFGKLNEVSDLLQKVSEQLIEAKVETYMRFGK